MNDFLNTYSGWLSLVALVLSVPIGILTNLATPRFQAWTATLSKKAIQQRINSLERSITRTDRLISEPTYAISAFVTTAAVAISGAVFYWVITFGLVLGVLITTDRPAFLGQMRIEFTPRNIFAFLAGVIFQLVMSYIFFRPSFDLRRMAERVRSYQSWREQTLGEIEELKNRLSGRKLT